MSLSKWLPCDFEQCHPLLWGGGILVDHWSTISSCHSTFKNYTSKFKANTPGHTELKPPPVIGTLLVGYLHSSHNAPMLTHWGWVMHKCVSKLSIIGSDNGLSPGSRQAIIWTNAGILLIGPLGMNSEFFFIKTDAFSFRKTHLKKSSAKWPSFFLHLNVLMGSLTHWLQCQ